MSRRTILAAVAVATLALAPPAGAKEVTALEVCGVSGCTAIDVPTGLHEFPGGSGLTTSPPRAAAFVEIAVTIEGSHVERLWYVPASRRFALRGEADTISWTKGGSQRIDRLVAAAAAGIEPYRPKAVAALVGDARVSGDVSGYLDLFSVASTGPARITTDRFVSVSVKTEPASPWALTGMWFYPEQGLLQRGVEVIRLPAGIADDLRQARSISASGSGEGFDWPLVSVSLLVAAALGLAAALLARRGRQPHAESV